MRKTALFAASLLLAAQAFAAEFTVVVDAGSTGTRVYKISEPGCGAPQVEPLGTGGPLAASQDDMLARLLSSIEPVHPEIADAEIRVIGTGGFRRLDGGSAQTCEASCLAKRQSVLDATRAIFPQAKLHVATGEEEGQLSRLSVAALTGDAGAVTVEIGGATVQVANPSESRMAAIDIKSLMPKVPACTARPADFASCRAQLSGVLSQDGDAARLLDTPASGATVVGVGGVFANMSHLLGSQDVTLEAVDDLGRRVCPAGEGFEAKYKDQACTQLALASILVERFHVARLADVSLEIGAAFAQNDDLGTSGLAASCPLAR